MKLDYSHEQEPFWKYQWLQYFFMLVVLKNSPNFKMKTCYETPKTKRGVSWLVNWILSSGSMNIYLVGLILL